MFAAASLTVAIALERKRGVAINVREARAMLFWVPIAASGTIAAVATSLDILSARRKRAKSRCEAYARLRSLFVEAMARLNNLDAYSFINEAKVQHDAALAEFRRWVDKRQIANYEAAVQAFDRCRRAVQPTAVKVLTSLQSRRPVDYSDLIELKNALNALMHFTLAGKEGNLVVGCAARHRQVTDWKGGCNGSGI